MNQFLQWATKELFRVGVWAHGLAASSDPVDKFFLHALDREFQFGNCSATLFEDRMREFDGFLSRGMAGLPRELFSRFLDEKHSPPRNGPATLAGHATGCRDHCVGARAMRSQTFVDMLLRQRRVPLRRSSPGRIARRRDRDPASPMIRNLTLERLLHGDITPDELETMGLWLRGRDGYFWLTPIPRFTVPHLLNALPLDSRKLVPFLARLGLAYSHTSIVLVFCDLGASGEPHIPTVFESRGWHPYFRPAWREDRWGESVCILNLARGLREAVMSDTRFSRNTPLPHEAGATPDEAPTLFDEQWDRLLESSENELLTRSVRARNC